MKNISRPRPTQLALDLNRAEDGPTTLAVVPDNEAGKIGSLYRKAKESIVASIKYAIEAGERLTKIKAALRHGEWLPWLAANAEALGFEAPQTAQKLMKLYAKSRVDAVFDVAKATAVSRKMWGNDTPRGACATGKTKLHTPNDFLDAVRKVIGPIDLNPASSAVAQRTVQTAKYYTKMENPPDEEWNGAVWLNPPSAQPLINRFVDKLLFELEAGRVTSAILLTHSCTDAPWFQIAAAKADAICFTRGRRRFVSPEGELASPAQGQAVFYFGDDVARFAETFTPLGFVVACIDAKQ